MEAQTSQGRQLLDSAYRHRTSNLKSNQTSTPCCLGLDRPTQEVVIDDRRAADSHGAWAFALGAMSRVKFRRRRLVCVLRCSDRRQLIDRRGRLPVRPGVRVALPQGMVSFQRFTKGMNEIGRRL